MSYLLIVESPNKIKKIKSYLPADWEVAASVGHIRDLPEKSLGIDLAANFRPLFKVCKGKRAVVAKLKRLVAQVGTDRVYLGTDPDREGEAIAYHLCRVLGLDIKTAKRVSFNQLSKAAIIQALASPRPLDLNLIAAQESRRVLDRLVGYQVSPLLWEHVQSNKPLSAGRVQSVALRLVVDQEQALEAYQPITKLGIKASFLTPQGEPLKAKYVGELAALDPEAVPAKLTELGRASYQILALREEEKHQAPPPPFITSSLQQAANKRLKFSVKQTTQLAQSLFEKGLITYVRTDSPHLSVEAHAMLRTYIAQTHGEEQYQPRMFHAKGNAQEAHEAIRPVQLVGENLTELTQAEAKLYELIKRRVIASQMADKRTDQTKIGIGQDDLSFEATVSVLKAPGWTAVYQEREETEEEKEVTHELKHPLAVGDPLSLKDLRATESLQQVPKRYDEASLVKALEKRGIGRPSTYAAIISVLFSRAYVKLGNHPGKAFGTQSWQFQAGKIQHQTKTTLVGKDQHKIYPLPAGQAVIAFLQAHLTEIIQDDFTKGWEDRFDAVAAGKDSYRETIAAFYTPFQALLAEVEKLPKQGKPKAKPLQTFGAIEVYAGKYGPYLKKGDLIVSVPKWEKIDRWNRAKAEEVFQQQLAYKLKRQAS